MKRSKYFKYNELWHNINWKLINKYVSNIQYKMVVAYNNGNKSELYRLQKKLMLSFAARALAVRKITSNEGGKTPGVDKIVWTSPAEKYKAIIELRTVLLTSFPDYKADKIKRVWIPKTNSNKLRPLGIPTLRDRALQMLVLMSMDPIVEETSDLHSYGSRKYRGTHDAILRLRHLLDKKASPMWIWDVDLENCFDTISHDFLINKTKEYICPFGHKYLCKWLKAEIVEKGCVIKPTQGIPQGGVISPLLCNISLNGLEHVVRQGVTSHKTTLGKKLTGCWVTRYVDDFVVTSRSKELLELELIPKIKEFLSERNLKVSEEKSKIINLKNTDLKFLGWTISLKSRIGSKNQSSPKDDVLLIKPTRESVQRLMVKINQIFRKKTTLESLVYEINPVLRGWANYYRISWHSFEDFKKIHNHLYFMVMRFLTSLHLTKPISWIHKEYIHKLGNNNWRFGININKLMYCMVETDILKLKILKSGINPYFNAYYYEVNPRMFELDEHRRKIYKFHNYKCAACGKTLLDGEQIDLHHVIPKSEGGDNSYKNLIPLHKTCHVGITHARKQWFKYKSK